jgi:hypothetical protein
MPEEIFGGPSLQKLAEGRFERNVEKKLPRAEIAFLDEVFRGGSHILNTLLTVINEKRFDSGDGKGSIHVPLLALIGASNTAPHDPDLEAFFDRFPVRVWMRSVFDHDSRVDEPDSNVGWDLLIRSTKAESQRIAVGWSPDQATAEMHKKMQSCTNDFRFARAYLLRRLQRVRADDRSYTQLWLFAGALDWLRGNEPDSGYPDADGHLEVFRYVARSEADVAFLDHQVSQHSNGVHHTGR